MRLLQHITESFNRPYKYSFDGNNSREDYEYSFKTDNNVNYTFSATLGFDYGGTKLEGLIKKKTDVSLNYHDGYFNYFDIQFYIDAEENKRDNIGISGTGDAMRVLATVLVIMKDFLKREEPQIIVFTADEKSRRKLYDRMIKVLSSKFKYKLIGTYSVSYGTGTGKEYVLWSGK